MNCKYLIQSRIQRCAGSEQLLNPSIFELALFCHGNPEECSIYQEREKYSYKKDLQSATEITTIPAENRVDLFKAG